MDERSLFLAALEHPSDQDRDSWLRDACGENAPLRERVAALLAAHDSGSSLLEQSPLANSMLPTQALNTDTSPTVKNSVVIRDVSQSAILRDVVQPSTREGSLGRLGPYEILAILGKGGMGVVLKGHDPKLNRQVAVKVLATHLAANPDSRKRFLREAQAAAKVVHSNVVTIFAVDDGEPPYLAMELVEGESLQEKLDREGLQPLEEILRIASQIAEGLAAAHGHGLVHRDIKPANILIEKSTGRVKITDFGLARAIDDVALTGSGLIVGTPLYMSPEQAQGHAVDHRSDLFSLGSVIYAMGTAQSPFHAETTIAVIRRVCDEETRPLHEVNRKLPPWLGQLVSRLIAKEPAERLIIRCGGCHDLSRADTARDFGAERQEGTDKN